MFQRGGSEGETKRSSRNYKPRNNKQREDRPEGTRGGSSRGGRGRGGRGGRGGRNNPKRKQNTQPKPLDPNSPPFFPSQLIFDSYTNQESNQ